MPATPALPGKKRLSGCAIAAIVTGSLGLLGIIFILGIWFLASSLTADVVKAAEDYLATLNRGQTREAYEMSASGLRKETSLAQFNKVVAQFPILNHHTAFKVNSRNLQNEIGTVTGELSDGSGKRADIEFILVKENGVWRVLSLHVKMIAWQKARDAGYEKRLVDSSTVKKNATEVILWS